ncbi:ankyrin repeat-containing domain protein [Annulohypoxylon truncatum]|uniref:ankyrin repeat-containing domain protein n=1 Tax=Annulohypoxylon truncatum TaxID=327061 RepID=UPI002007AC86|nr:ankyrin repeat-containing domain protein [Annulohypoxylon truncatum]KAI1204678.1 ankyrin repeat-containing domain protein [Annulohypoxylon truncatum]
MRESASGVPPVSEHVSRLDHGEPSPLLTACVFGLQGLLDLTLSHLDKINLEQLSDTGHTPLYLACTFGHSTIASRLIEHGADANAICGNYGNPLQAACFRGHTDVVKILLKHGVSPRASTATFKNGLHAACEGSRADIADLLIKTNSVIETGEDYEDALQTTAEAGFLDAVEYLMKPDVVRKFGRDTRKKERGYALTLGTIKKGRVGILQSLLQSDPGMAGNLPKDAMAIAALYGHVDMLGLLHDLGIDIEAEGKFGSPLRSASLQGNTSAVRKLLSLGASTTGRGSRGDSLQAAAGKGYTHIMRLLISHKADVNQPGKPCGNPIQAASYHGHEEVVKLLIEEGADIYCRSSKFMHALHAAVRGGHQEIALFLQHNYPPRPGEIIRVVSRGGRRKRFGYSKTKIPNPMDERNRELGSPHPEDTDDEDVSSDEESESSNESESDDGYYETRHAFVLAAGIGDISTIRQELRRPDLTEEDIREALSSAASKGSHQATTVLLEEGLRHTLCPRELTEEALVAAAKHKQQECFQILAESLSCTVFVTTWAASLKAAAEVGEQSIAAQILDFATLADDHYLSSRNRYAKSVPANTVRICRDAIEAAYSSKHHQVANLTWHWVLSRGPELLGSCSDEWANLCATAARFADASTLETCLELEEMGPDYANRPRSSRKEELLLNAVQCQNLCTFRALLKIIEQETHVTRDIIPSFMEACRQGFNEGALQLLSSNKFVLKATEIAQGIVAASTFGHAELVLELLRSLECSASDISIIDEAVTDTLLSAARAGKSGVFQHILDNTEIRDHRDFDTLITRALVTACEWGHKDMVELCLHEGADVEMNVPKAPTNVGSGLESEEHDTNSDDWEECDINSEDSNATSLKNYTQNKSALQASVEAFSRICERRRMPGSNTQSATAEAGERPQTEIVRLILDHMPDLSRYSTRHTTHPLQIAVQSGAIQAVELLLEHGAANGFSPGQLTDLVLLVSNWRTYSAFRIIVQLLNCDHEALPPTTEDGFLHRGMLRNLGMALDPAMGDTVLFRRFYIPKKVAQGLMEDGLREFMQIIFRRLPHQMARGKFFGIILHVAAAAGDLLIVRQLMQRNVNVHQDLYRRMPLDTAAWNGQIHVMKALTRVRINKVRFRKSRIIHSIHKDQEPAFAAILNGQILVLKLLLDSGVDLKLIPDVLVLAVESQALAMLKFLLQAGADPNAEPLALITAAHDGRLDMVTSLLGAGADANALAIYGSRTHEVGTVCSPLYLACREGHTEVVRKLLGGGAHAALDVGDWDGLPLVAAARRGHLAIVEALLESGCNPTHSGAGFRAVGRQRFRETLGVSDHKLSAGRPRPWWDFAFIIRSYPATNSVAKSYSRLNAIEGAYLSQKGFQPSPRMLRVLLKAVGDPDERKGTCLEAMKHISEAQHSRVFEELLEYVPLDSNTLDLSCRCGSLKAVRKILDHGLSVNVTNADGETMLQVAIDYGHSELIQFLLANGANLNSPEDEGRPLNLYRLVASVIESYAFSTRAKHKSITRCEDMVLKLLRIAHDPQMVFRADQEFLNRSLILACHVGSVEMATGLLKLGAELDSLSYLPQHSPAYRPSPLFAAIESNHPSTLSLLLLWGHDAENGTGTISSLDAEFKACISKASPVLLQTFLRCAVTLEISQEHLVLAAQKIRWRGGVRETGLQIILQHRPDLTPSEEVLVTLLRTGAPSDVWEKRSMLHLYKLVLKRSDCGITTRMLQTMSDRATWEAIFEYHQGLQMFDELEAALQRVEESERGQLRI